MRWDVEVSVDDIFLVEEERRSVNTGLQIWLGVVEGFGD